MSPVSRIVVFDDASSTPGSSKGDSDDSDVIVTLLPDIPFVWGDWDVSPGPTQAPPSFYTGPPTIIGTVIYAATSASSKTLVSDPDPLPVSTSAVTMITVTTSPGAVQTGPSWSSLYAAERNATRPMKMLAAIFGVFALVLVILIVSIVAYTRIRRRRLSERTRVRSVFLTSSRELVLSSSQPPPPPPQPYATPGQERWAKQWEGLSHAAVTPRQPELPLGGATLTSTRTRTMTFLVNTLSGRWSRSLTNDSPGNPPSYRSPSYSGSNADGDRSRDAIAQSPLYRAEDSRSLPPLPQEMTAGLGC